MKRSSYISSSSSQRRSFCIGIGIVVVIFLQINQLLFLIHIQSLPPSRDRRNSLTVDDDDDGNVLLIAEDDDDDDDNNIRGGIVKPIVEEAVKVVDGIDEVILRQNQKFENQGICEHEMNEVRSVQRRFISSLSTHRETIGQGYDGPGPLHYFAYMDGQGFGRIVQHSCKSCLLAALLHRPCSIDMVRDKYYNLRSFLRPSPMLDWEYTSDRLSQQKVHTNIHHALHMMPKGVLKGHGWEDLPSEALPKYDDVLPMIWHDDVDENKSQVKDGVDPRTEKIGHKLALWDGNNINHGHKVLLSPNFGDAWYGYGKDYVHLNSQWESRIDLDQNEQVDDSLSTSKKPCTANYMKTALQNEMFMPTSLAHELHNERKKLLFQNDSPSSNNQDTTTDAVHEYDEEKVPYGAIHLRMNILNKDMYKMGVSKERVLEGLKDCFEQLTDNYHQHQEIGIPKWWLISDNIEVAQYISQNVDNVYSYANTATVVNPAAAKTSSLSTAAIAANNNIKVMVKGAHSGDAINRKFGQEDLAPSIIDWMGLHESDIALVTYDSAYGETGARGNGKVFSGHCGGIVEQQQPPPQLGADKSKQQQRLKFPMFFIYRRPL